MKKKKIKRIIGLVLLSILIILMIIGFIIASKPKYVKLDHNKLAKNHYKELVMSTKKTNLYNEKDEIIGSIDSNTSFNLDGIKERRYKIKDTNYYIDYLDTKRIEEIETPIHTEYSDYKNYIPYNINIITNEAYELYKEDTEYLEIKSTDEYPVIIKMSDRYGIEFNNQLFYIKKDDVKEEKGSNNTSLEIANDLPVLNYHYTINRAAGEFNQCDQTICMEDTQVEEEIKYLSDNNFYTPSMRDVYLYLTGAIQLPKRTVTITIDDGWFVGRMVTILEKYNKVGTLFLIGSLLSPDEYRSKNLEIHSHTWNMHNIGECRGNFGGAILCKSREYILEDLKKSRESLNNTTVFCFPFYEYNANALNLVKEAGFEMAFVGGNRSARVGDNLFEIPRFVMLKSTTMNKFISYIS